MKYLSIISINILLSCNELKDIPTINTKSLALEKQINNDEVICGFNTGKLPEFVGGYLEMNKYVSQNVSLGIGESKPPGKIFIRFDVLADGSVENVEILKGAEKSPILRQNLIKVFQNMPKWNPGENYVGKVVKVKMIFPVLIKFD